MLFVTVESFRAALTSIAALRFRAFLTSLGIIVGVGSIIALVSVIQGLNASVLQMFHGLGSNNLSVTSFTSPENQLRGQYARLLPEDLTLVRERVDGVSAITPIVYSQINPNSTSRVRFGQKSSFTRVIGTTRNYQRLAQLTISQGRFLYEGDNATRRRVAVLGESVRSKLLLPPNPIGQYIEVNAEWVKVIGMTKAKGEAFGFDQDDFILLPHDTMQSLLGNQVQSDIQIMLEVDDIARVGEVRENIRRLIRSSHRLTPADEDDFKIQTPEQLLSNFTDFIRSITGFTVGIISLSLLVGGIGIMNIMLVSVKERTREIGICKALGARRYHILLQFLFEAIIVCCVGALAGLLLGYGVGMLLAKMLSFPAAQVPAWAVALALGSAVFVGVTFGMLPAAKAASLHPIEALRYE